MITTSCVETFFLNVTEKVGRFQIWNFHTLSHVHISTFIISKPDVIELYYALFIGIFLSVKNR